MKNLTKKDLELNPSVVTGLTGSGEQPKGNTDASENPVCTVSNECGTMFCGTSFSKDVQCCDTIQADTCNIETNFVCPATDGCETNNDMCPESEGCPPIIPTETTLC